MTNRIAKKDLQPVYRFITTCTLAAIIRYLLMVSRYQRVIGDHVEVSTPMNSWKRVAEGLYLLSRDVDPYSGDLLHETPLSLMFYKVLLEVFWNQVHLMFLTFDVLTGIILFFVALNYRSELYKEEKQLEAQFAKDTEEYIIKPDDGMKAAYYVLMAFLFNPFTLFSCVGYSTTVFNNFFLAVMLFSMVYNLSWICAVSMSICASISLYPFVLIIPTTIHFANIYKSTTKTVGYIAKVMLSVLLILLFCSKYGKDFSFLKSIYGCILLVPDLQPNIGLFWYFFTEMFDHFRDLFIYAFQINASILYILPLSLKFRKHQFLLTISILFLNTIFKSYPSIGDVGFVFSLLCCFIHLFSFSQQAFLVGVILLISSSLAPILWYLWIYCNSANANFYFGVTLAFAIAQIFLLTDILFAQVKRQFILKNGKGRKIEGSEGLLCLE